MDKDLPDKSKTFQVEACCSFCGKTRSQVKQLLASRLGPAFICNECVILQIKQKDQK